MVVDGEYKNVTYLNRWKWEGTEVDEKINFKSF
jgi:hypothetical protein